MKLVIAIFALLVLSPQGFAKGKACKAEKSTICKDSGKGKKGFRKCLFENWAQVSPECKTKTQAKYDRWMKKGHKAHKGQPALAGQKIQNMKKMNSTDSMKKFKKSQKSTNCGADIAKLCSTVTKGNGRRGRCLFEKWGQVSQQCQDHRKVGFERWNQRQVACGSDITKFCNTVEHGEGRMGQCLRKQKTNLGQSCQTFLQIKRDNHKQKLAVCQPDIQQHCTGIKKGGGATWKCLVENQSSLSQTCLNQWPSLTNKANHMKRKAANAERRTERMNRKEMKKAMPAVQPTSANGQ